MPVLEIKDDVFWVGTVDWNLRDFHGYSMARKGTTYNAFLVKDEKSTLFDTVNSRFMQEFLSNIKALVDPPRIEYIVVNHVEPDHSGCLVEIVDLVKPEKIFCSRMGKAFMISHYHREDWPYEVVKTGDSLSLGQKTVQFLELKMLHWPDNMGCYIREDKLFISSDAFGHNWATSERFDDEVDFSEIRFHLAHYFANIILPYAANATKALDKIEAFGWAVDMIAPDHGLIFRTHVEEAIEAYRTFAQQKAKAKAVIVYDTMWSSTRKMAHAIAEGLTQEEISVKIFDMKKCHHSDVMAEVLDAKAVLMGSPTHNRGVLPLIAEMLRYMEGLRPQGKVGAAFGSYGWGDCESVSQLTQALVAMNMEVLDVFKVKNVPTDKDLQRCVQMGKTVAQAIKERL
ncbi:MAG: flavodoxin domain-containing protein [Desulfobacteraceae bacterium]|jgi:flavorubredoxin